MRFLIVGAGALGGYFGGRLLEAGQDVTFLLRPRRAAELDRTGLVIKSPRGDLKLPSPPRVTAAEIGAPFDVVVVGCKAYDLPQTMESFAPAVGPDTMILPLLNGMQHIDQLAQRFRSGQVLGGQCLISAALDPEGIVMHLNEAHLLTFGELDGSDSARIAALKSAFAEVRFDTKASLEIRQEMWEKWVFIASVAGITGLMRATIGDIVNAGAADLAVGMLDECSAIADNNGFAPRAAIRERARAMLTAADSPITASMLKDMERGAPIEADHIVGDLLRRGPETDRSAPLLRVAYAHMKAYEARRARQALTAG